MKRFFPVIFVLCLSATIAAAQKQHKEAKGEECLELAGIATDDNGETDSVRVVLYKGDEVLKDFVTSKKNKLFFVLDKNLNYSLSFSKKGFVTRILCINTTVPFNLRGDLPLGFEFEIHMIPEQNQYNDYYLDFPAAYIYYDSDKAMFDYNAKYAEWIKSHYSSN